MKEKKHLNIHYKTKPCKQYFFKGFCNYGLRCQYLHSEIKDNPEFSNYLVSAYQENCIPLSFLAYYKKYNSKLDKVVKNYKNDTPIDEFLVKFCSKRFLKKFYIMLIKFKD